MSITIVDNGTIHLDQLQRLCGDGAVVVTPEHIRGQDFSPTDVVVLSGSHTRPVAGNLDYFAEELALIDNAPCAIIGVCLGFELIVAAAGGELEQMDHKTVGVVDVAPTPEGLNWFGDYQIPVAEGHRWILRFAPTGYVELARSTDGVEAIANLDRRIVGFQFHPEFHTRLTLGGQAFRQALARLRDLA